MIVVATKSTYVPMYCIQSQNEEAAFSWNAVSNLIEYSIPAKELS